MRGRSAPGAFFLPEVFANPNPDILSPIGVFVIELSCGMRVCRNEDAKEADGWKARSGMAKHARARTRRATAPKLRGPAMVKTSGRAVNVLAVLLLYSAMLGSK
eukprot:3923651-Rhodomonas_salina.1